ncbi:hypothetical protein ABZ924_12340 [Streptomyces sp. NPDC046876]|uniref:hypothetical protein n=1 Tax=Streptomyces sp. NPDC046876 TaxID=3155616 RepID=UPI0033DF5204
MSRTTRLIAAAGLTALFSLGAASTALAAPTSPAPSGGQVVGKVIGWDTAPADKRVIGWD